MAGGPAWAPAPTVDGSDLIRNPIEERRIAVLLPQPRPATAGSGAATSLAWVREQYGEGM